MQFLERRPYGTTGEQVTTIGLGGVSLAKYSIEDGVATVGRALELGVNYFDTVPFPASRDLNQTPIACSEVGYWLQCPSLLAISLGKWQAGTICSKRGGQVGAME